METKLKIEKQGLNASPITEEHSLFFGKVFRGMSAYQYAVESGLFSGTEEEFAQYLGNIENVTNACEEATESTIAAKDNAVQATANAIAAKEAAESATANATQATADANAATKNANQATASTNEAIARAEQATEEATQAASEAQEATANANEAADRANEEVDKLKEKADTDGSYPEMTVGKAENLVGRGEATEEYINFRQSDGEVSIDDGSAKITKIKGNSVVYNQLFNYTDKTVSDGGVTAITTPYKISLSGIATATTNINNIIKPLIKGNRYLMFAECLANPNNISFVVSPLNVGGNNFITLDNNNKIGFVFFPHSLDRSNSNVGLRNFGGIGTDLSGIEYRIWCIDLTKEFGVGNEPKNIDEFYARKPVGVNIFAYNTGEILSNNATAIKSVGENAYDYRVGYAKVLGGKTYNFEGTYTKIEFATTLDGTRETITLNENKQYTFEQEGYVFAEGSDICINLQYSYDKEFLHDYQQSVVDLSFIKSIKDSDGNELFRNGLASIPPQRDSNGNIIAGTDVYDEIRYNATTKKWEAIKKIGDVDLGSLDWQYGNSRYSDKKTMRSIAQLDNVKKPATTLIISNILSNVYRVTNAEGVYDVTQNGVSLNVSGQIYLFDSDYTDTQIFKQAMQERGEKLYYELEEPIIVELDTNFNPTYLVWDFGTEEAIASVPSAPFRADIVYQFNAVDRIRNNSDRIAELEAKIASLVQTMNAIQTTNLEE